MRILVVKPILPYPPNQGTCRVTLALLKALGRDHEVILAAPLKDPAEMRWVPELERVTGCRVLCRLSPNRRSRAHRAAYRIWYGIRSALGGHSPRALYASPRNLLDAVRELVRLEPVDLAVFEYWHTYRYMAAVSGRRRVLLAHDAEFRVNELARADRSPRHRLSRVLWAANEARREREACAVVDEVWTLVPEDAAALSAASGVPMDRFRVLPFGVDTETLAAPAGSGGDTVLFFGSFAADFNRDALEFLLDDVWPLVTRSHPSASLVVAGGGLPPRLRRRAVRAGAACPGSVDDLPALYASAAVVLIPLRFGGGLRIRLLEALACSRAVVATPVGIGHLAGEPGSHFEVEPDAAGLARCVSALLKNPERRKLLGQAGRRLVEDLYSERAATRGIRSLVGSRGGD